MCPGCLQVKHLNLSFYGAVFTYIPPIFIGTELAGTKIHAKFYVLWGYGRLFG